MKFLNSGMADLKLRLLDRIAQSRKMQDSPKLSSERNELNKSTICRAVEDRLCKRIDLATRNDLTNRQAMEALCLLIGIVRRNGLLVDFSTREIALLTHGVPDSLRVSPIYQDK